MKDHYEKKSGEMGSRTPSICPPCSCRTMGLQFKPDRMAEMGYTLHLDTQHKDRDYPTRWWFRGEHNRERVIQGIKAQGFEVITINL